MPGARENQCKKKRPFFLTLGRRKRGILRKEKSILSAILHAGGGGRKKRSITQKSIKKRPWEKRLLLRTSEGRV